MMVEGGRGSNQGAGSRIHPHAQQDTGRSEDGVQKDEPEAAHGREASLSHTGSECKGLKPFVGKEGDEEGGKALPGALGGHSHSLQETMDGEGKDKDGSLGFGGGRVDAVHVAATDNIVFVTSSMLLIRLKGEILMVLGVVVIVGAVSVMMVMFVGSLLGSRSRVSIGTVGVGQEETIDGEEDEEGDSSKEGAPSEAVGVAFMTFVIGLGSDR